MKSQWYYALFGFCLITGCSATGADMPSNGFDAAGKPAQTATTDINVGPQPTGVASSPLNDDVEIPTGVAETPAEPQGGEGGVGSRDYNPEETAGTAGTPPATSTGGDGDSKDPPLTGGTANVPPETGGEDTSRDVGPSGGKTCTHTGGEGGSRDVGKTGGKATGGTEECGCPEGGTQAAGGEGGSRDVGTGGEGGSRDVGSGGQNEGGSRDVGSGGVAGGSAGEAGSRDITGGEGGSRDTPPTGGTSSGGTASGGTSTGGTGTGGECGDNKFKIYITDDVGVTAVSCYSPTTGQQFVTECGGCCYFPEPLRTCVDDAGHPRPIADVYCQIMTSDEAHPVLPEAGTDGNCTLYAENTYYIDVQGDHITLERGVYWDIGFDPNTQECSYILYANAP